MSQQTNTNTVCSNNNYNHRVQISETLEATRMTGYYNCRQEGTYDSYLGTMQQGNVNLVSTWKYVQSHKPCEFP